LEKFNSQNFYDHIVVFSTIVAYNFLDNCEDKGYNLEIFAFDEDGTDITDEMTQYEYDLYIDKIESRIADIKESSNEYY